MRTTPVRSILGGIHLGRGSFLLRGGGLVFSNIPPRYLSKQGCF
nr:MAG TPA: hypothetical protein [Caudoviricetes sp.]